jgi:hypothetical protein
MEAADGRLPSSASRRPLGQWLEVRYEDVLGDPRGQVTAMLEFLGLRWTPEFEPGSPATPSRPGAGRHTAATSNLTSSSCSSGASPVTCRPTGTQRSSGQPRRLKTRTQRDDSTSRAEGRTGGHTSDRLECTSSYQAHETVWSGAHSRGLPGRPTDPGTTSRSGRFRVRPVRQDQPSLGTTAIVTGGSTRAMTT